MIAAHNLHLQGERLPHLDVHPAEARVRPLGHEVIPVGNRADLPLGVVEAAGRRSTLHESETLQDLGLRLRPNEGGVPGAVEGLLELS